MTAIERTVWPVIGRPGQQELEEKYTLTQAEIRFMRERFRREGRNKKYPGQADYESSCYRMARECEIWHPLVRYIQNKCNSAIPRTTIV